MQTVPALAGLVLCLYVSAYVWQYYSHVQPMWPLPALYLVEIPLLTIAGVIDILLAAWTGGAVGWLAAGAVLGFSIMGMFSVGMLYVPVALGLALGALVADIRQKHRLLLHLALFLAAGVGQAVLMLALTKVV